jgi:hypothetical protein
MDIEGEMLEAHWVEVRERAGGRQPFGETFGGTVVAIAGGFALAFLTAMVRARRLPHPVSSMAS